MYFVFPYMYEPREISYFSFDNILLYKGGPILTIILGVGLLLYFYLEVGYKSKIISTEGNKLNDNNIQRQFSKLKKEIDEKIRDLDKEELHSQNIEQLIESAIDDKIDQKVLDNFEVKYSSNAIEEIKWKRFEDYSETLEYNLEKYIAKLSRNGTINLIIGTLTTIIAVTILGFLVFEKDVDFSSSTNVLRHYLPRISISIFIEIFSFFFLKLYRGNLNDVKYFENERTNIKSKLLAFKTAYLMNDESSMKLAMENFINTERNFKLIKGETTVELEKTKVSSAQESKWMDFIKNMWNSKK